MIEVQQGQFVVMVERNQSFGASTTVARADVVTPKLIKSRSMGKRYFQYRRELVTFAGTEEQCRAIETAADNAASMPTARASSSRSGCSKR